MFKRLIKKYLGIDEIEERQDYLDKLFKSYLNVATDISPSQKGISWAIVYLEGKPEVLRFYGGSKYEIWEIRDFLRQFNKENQLIDAPLAMKPFFDRI